MKYTKVIWVLLRFIMGFIMLWAFLDKLWGLGFATTSDQAWVNGVSPTAGFLQFGVHGIFSNVFQSLAGSQLVDWLFMLGLLGIGLALLLGIGMQIAGYAGALMMFLMYLSLFPPQNNPLIDEHIVYILIFIGLAQSESGDIIGFGKWWKGTPLVANYKFLR